MRQIWGMPSPSRTDSEQTQKFRKFGGFLQITDCQTQSAEFGDSIPRPSGRRKVTSRGRDPSDTSVTVRSTTTVAQLKSLRADILAVFTVLYIVVR